MTDDLSAILADPDGGWLDTATHDRLSGLAPRLLAAAATRPDQALPALGAAARAYQVLFDEYYVRAPSMLEARHDLVAGYLQALGRQVQLLAAAGRHGEVVRLNEQIMAANEQVNRKAQVGFGAPQPQPPVGGPGGRLSAADLDRLEPGWVERTPIQELAGIAQRLHQLAGELEPARQLEPALRAITEAVAAQRRVVGQIPDGALLADGGWQQFAGLLEHRTRLLHATGRPAEVAVVDAELSALQMRVNSVAAAPPDQPSVSELRQAGDLTAARVAQERLVANHERVLGPDAPAVAIEVGTLASICWELGDQQAARTAAERAVSLHDRAAGAPSAAAAEALNTLGSMCWHLRDLPAARAALERAVATTEQVSGPGSVELARRLAHLGTVHYDLADYPTARAALERAVDLLERWFPYGHRDTAFALLSLAQTQRALGDVAATRTTLRRAEARYTDVLRRDERRYGAEHARTARTRHRLRAVQQELESLPPPPPDTYIDQEHIFIRGV